MLECQGNVDVGCVACLLEVAIEVVNVNMDDIIIEVMQSGCVHVLAKGVRYEVSISARKGFWNLPMRCKSLSATVCWKSPMIIRTSGCRGCVVHWRG